MTPTAALLLLTCAPAAAPDFTRDVEPILTKAGCNSGACHGAQHGRGGFRLSLRGYDPAFDYDQIVREDEGRRVVLSRPSRSIFLRKPTLEMEHGGGRKLDDRQAAVLRQWLTSGAVPPADPPPRVTRLTVTPDAKTMRPDESMTLRVLAEWDGRAAVDVTGSASFDALNPGVAVVTPSGQVTCKAAGQTHVLVRFAGASAVARVTSPYAVLDEYPDLKAHNFVDELLAAKWRELGLTPSPLCDDATFLRRLHLDVIGTLPTPAEVRAFVADASPRKRAAAIDAVLGRPEFADYWTLKFGDLLRINSRVLHETGMRKFRDWVREAVRSNTPMDRFATEILTAKGGTFADGPVNFYRLSRTAEDRAEAASQLFLGVRLQCAKCHHHPFENWSQGDYHGMAAFFARMSLDYRDAGDAGREMLISLRDAGEQRHPRTRQIIAPHAFGKELTAGGDRRVALADWLTGPDNPYFARNFANRFWGYLMGRGLVEPLDDLRASNPASNPELLDALADDFAKSGYDLRHLMRQILNSRAYQRSSTPTRGNIADSLNVHFTRYTVKRVAAEALADAIDAVTGVPTAYPGAEPGTRAVQLPDPTVTSYLLDVFGRPQRALTCECERGSGPNVSQALHTLNGRNLGAKIAHADGRVAELMKRRATPEVILTELYLRALSREPTAAERAKAVRWLAAAPDRRTWARDLCWVLLNSREFQFIQ